MLTLLALTLLQSAPFEGTFRADQGVVVLKHRSGVVAGTLTLGSERVRLRGKIIDGALTGQAIDGFRKQFTFRATLVDGVLSLTIEKDTIDFTRQRRRSA